MDYYRQGDVVIIPVAGTPDKELTEVKRDAGRVILAYGEVTGHSHAIADKDVQLFSIPDATVFNERFLSIPAGGATVTHEEHGPIQLPEGMYEVRIEREYSPEELRRVLD